MRDACWASTMLPEAPPIRLLGRPYRWLSTLVASSLSAGCLTSSAPPPAAPSPGAEHLSFPQLQVSNQSSVGLEDAGFLPNWANAGYQFGAELPRSVATHSVLDFGAIPNDGKDDTVAFKRALTELNDSVSPVVLEIPAGEFDLSDVLYLTRGHFTLKGAGSDKTRLRFTRSLAEMQLPERITKLRQYLRENDKRVDGQYFSEFSWTGGVIWSRLPTGDPIDFDGLGPFLGTPVSALSGRRGTHQVTVSSTHGLAVGESFKIRWANKEGAGSSFLKHLYGGQPEEFFGRLTEDPTRVLAEQDATIESINGKTLTLTQPLLHDLRPEWQVEMGQVAAIEELGIEGFTLAFPEQDFAGHHKEAGYNGLHLNDLRHSWVRDLVIENADSGVLTDRSAHITLRNVRVKGRGGHYGIHCGSVYGMLSEDFTVAAHFAHSVSFNTRCTGSVFHRGEISDGSLDQHRGVNHQNLYDSIIAHESDPQSELFQHGGAKYWGPPHGAYNTFWNIEVRFADSAVSSSTVSLGAVTNTARAYMSGLRSNSPAALRYENARRLKSPAVESLYESQRATALK